MPPGCSSSSPTPTYHFKAVKLRRPENIPEETQARGMQRGSSLSLGGAGRGVEKGTTHIIID